MPASSTVVDETVALGFVANASTVDVETPDGWPAAANDAPRISAKAVARSTFRCAAVCITISVFAVADANPAGNEFGSMGIGLIRNRQRDCIRVAKCKRAS